MRTLSFGGGLATTQIPSDWESGVDHRGVTIAKPPGQEVATLRVWTVSSLGGSVDRFIDSYLKGICAASVIEETPGAILTYLVDEQIKGGQKFESHQFQVLPKKAVGAHAVTAFLSLQIRRDDDAQQLIEHALHEARLIARRVTFDPARWT